jgi:hypothetical protein
MIQQKTVQKTIQFTVFYRSIEGAQYVHHFLSSFASSQFEARIGEIATSLVTTGLTLWRDEVRNDIPVRTGTRIPPHRIIQVDWVEPMTEESPNAD